MGYKWLIFNDIADFAGVTNQPFGVQGELHSTNKIKDLRSHSHAFPSRQGSKMFLELHSKIPFILFVYLGVIL